MKKLLLFLSLTAMAYSGFSAESEGVLDFRNIFWGTSRDEIKKLSGSLLESNQHSDDLIQIVTFVLNKGLRPHLTQYQARFRKWYAEELAKPTNAGKSPQEIQQTYPDYEKLVESMKEVNEILINYADQLKLFIKGVKPSA